MTNSNTDHSRALRVKTSKEWREKQTTEGSKKNISMFVGKDLADEFSSLCNELGLSKPKALRLLIEQFRNKA